MEEFLRVIISNLVENKDAVEINTIDKGKSVTFEVKVAQEDMGKVIGKQGRIAQAIRNVMKAVANMLPNLEIGQIVNTFGIKGMVKVKPFTDDIRRFDELKAVYVEKNGNQTEFEIEEVKYHKDMVLIKFKGIDKVEQAEMLRNSYLTVSRDSVEKLEEGRYYIVDLLGLEVYTDEQILLGTLEDIFNTGSNDIYVVKDKQGKQILLPAIQDVIKQIDIENKKIIVHLLPGLI